MTSSPQHPPLRARPQVRVGRGVRNKTLDGFSKVVDQIIGRAEGEAFPRSVFADVVALILRREEGVVGPG